MNRGTGTDADSITISGSGVKTALLSLPLRYMHSSVEVCSMTDVEYIIQLLVEFIIEMNKDTNFDPFGC